ncbi:MAG TPA: glycosyltransferase family 1 protein [Acidiphilium sp.]|nr:MAG: alpha-mannosyltransferase [Acidiphilium sp. 21-60-14]OYV92465.1 MAG: alpha-mannosyltransferase [Acidiphilium sp. 37-60-79]OZB38369.1 MAG: alpha-mannosyltransferase [Acidiphilium sp. 34-60-192]HQT87893.1 glycosyltransferase family 1 protein [Acidiphilium sp.]HQU22664.1 glycosyltransferase family 1 protein [Acidiphilium sp.]
MRNLPEPGRILIVSDAWHPQVNGVVRTLSMVVERLIEAGDVVAVIGPDRFRTLPCPTYPEIRLTIGGGGRLRRMIEDFAPDALHIATEGPLGVSAARIARSLGMAFTTAYHTRFPDYLAARLLVPRRVAYAWLRRFHHKGAGVMVATAGLAAELAARGFDKTLLWSRGVDATLFHPSRAVILPYQRPLFLSVGRLAVEKNLPAFLDLDLPGSKVIVGDGPARAALEQRYADAHTHFLGTRQGVALASLFASSDVFVFPSRTDTFGLVVLEALAAGTPVAAYPVAGPRDVMGGADPAVGMLSEDLRAACMGALSINPEHCRAYAEQHSWEACTRLFRKNLVAIGAAHAASFH